MLIAISGRLSQATQFRFVAVLVFVALASGFPARAGEEQPIARRRVEEAALRGLALVQKAAASYPTHRTCFSCHHQTLPMQTMVTAREYGLAIDEELLQDTAAFSHDSFRERITLLREGKGIGGAAMTVAYGLWAFELAGRAPDDLTEAMVTYLLKTQRPEGDWLTGGNRPPLEESTVTCAVLAVAALRHYAGETQRAAARAATERASAWMAQVPMKRQEDRNSRLWGLHQLEAGAEPLAQARADVLVTQHADGGWPARDDLPSDAYATGQTLWTLHATGLPPSDGAYQRGVRYLLEAQHEDGSWKVETRARPVQAYFDNGDPHGKHQFISTPATCWAVAALAAALTKTAVTASSTAAAAAEPYDLLIKGGTIVDGTGNPWFKGDLAIRGDRIAAIGRVDPETPVRRTLDATRLVVAPGFIDMHSHSDRPLLEDGAAQSKIRQGVTTEVLGEDTSGGPAKGRRPEEQFERDGKTYRWSTLGEYFDALESAGIATNVASYVGLGTLLGCVQGDALDRPTSTQLEAIALLLDEAMRDGAMGLSTMLAGARELNVTTDDLVALGQVVQRHGGIYSSHIRNEGTDVLAAVKEAIAIGERAQIPVDIIHIKIADQALWGRMNELVALIDAARRRGVNVQANVYPYTRGNNDLVTILPPWAHEGGKEALLDRLKDPEARARMKREIKDGLPGWYNHYTAVGGDWSRMLVSARLSAANRKFQGMTMDRILAERGKGQVPAPDPLDQLFDFLAEEGGAIGTIYAHHTEADMNLALAQSWCSIGSDGSAFALEGPLRRGHPHPRNFGTFPRVLGVYVRERHVLGLEDAVRKMTLLNAAKLGINDRGLLRPGLYADVTVFDPETVIDQATFLEPFQDNKGITAVIVNGQVVLDAGKHTGARPGRALRHIP
jgi:N-acyl-D-aspartate/D-glutamate deacylase